MSQGPVVYPRGQTEGDSLDLDDMQESLDRGTHLTLEEQRHLLSALRLEIDRTKYWVDTSCDRTNDAPLCGDRCPHDDARPACQREPGHGGPHQSSEHDRLYGWPRSAEAPTDAQKHMGIVLGIVENLKPIVSAAIAVHHDARDCDDQDALVRWSLLRRLSEACAAVGGYPDPDERCPSIADAMRPRNQDNAQRRESDPLANQGCIECGARPVTYRCIPCHDRACAEVVEAWLRRVVASYGDERATAARTLLRMVPDGAGLSSCEGEPK
jgi:hypothetical protein